MGLIHLSAGGFLISAAKPLIYNPHAQMDEAIRAAADSVAGVFDEIDAAYTKKGKSIKDSLQGSKAQVQRIMHRAIATSRIRGFQQAAAVSKKHMPLLYGHTIRADAESRAAEVGKLMRRTTKRGLNNNPDSDFLLSKDRAVSAARYEAGNSYFKGVRDAFQGNKDYLKAWITSAAESCEDCLDNESDGPIGMDEDFQSGHYFPLAHNNCSCYAGLVRA